MRKLLLACAAIAGLTGSAFAPAVASSVANSAVPSAAEIQRIQERQSVLLEAHLAGMKAGLKLNDEQARNWPAFESAIRVAARARSDRWTQARDRMAQGEPFADRTHDHHGRSHRENRDRSAEGRRSEQVPLREPRRCPKAGVRSVDARVQAPPQALGRRRKTADAVSFGSHPPQFNPIHLATSNSRGSAARRAKLRVRFPPWSSNGIADECTADRRRPFE